MRDCCQDKSSPYDIRQEEGKLIRAAISLGEWLASQDEATEPQRVAIAKMLAFLRNLPDPPPLDLHGEFGFEFVHPNGDSCTWTVCVCRTMFEIFCCGRDDLPQLRWLLYPGEVNRNDLSKADAWISQVSDPHALAIPNHSFVIEASTWTVSPKPAV